MKPCKTPEKPLLKNADKEPSREPEKQVYLKQINWPTTETHQNANSQPESSKTQQLNVAKDNKLLESTQIKKTTVATEGIKNIEGETNTSKRNKRRHSGQEPSLPIIDEDRLTEVINIEDHSKQKQSRKDYGNQNDLANNLKAAPKPPSPVEQTSQPNQHNDQRPRSITTSSNNQKPRNDNVLINGPATSQIIPSSPPAKLRSQIESARNNICDTPQNSADSRDRTKLLQKPSTQQPLPAYIPNPSCQEPSTLITNNINRAPVGSMTIGSEEIQHAAKTNAVFANDPKIVPTIPRVTTPQNVPIYHQQPGWVRQDVPAPQKEIQPTSGKDLPQKPTSQNLDPRLRLENHRISEVPQHQPMKPSFNNNPTSVPSQFRHPLKTQHQVQGVVNQRDAQQSQRPPYRPILPKKDTRSPPFQGVTKTMPPPASPRAQNSMTQAIINVLENYPLDEQELHAILNRIPTEQKKPGLANVLRNIGVLLALRVQNSKTPTSSSNQLPRTEPSSIHQNVDQYLGTQTQQVDQSDKTNLTTKRVRVQDHTVSSATKQIGVIDNGLQTNVSMQEGWSLRDSAAPNSEININSETASGYEITTNEVHETAHQIDQTEHNSVDRSTAQNFLSKFAMQQKMMEQFTTACTQMSSTLRNAANVFDDFRESFFETSENSASNASSSNNVTQEAPPVVEDSQNSAPEERNFINDNQQSSNLRGVTERIDSNDSKKHLDSRRWFVLPPEYDPKDTKWTLKYRNLESGLVELRPKTNIYVNFYELKRFEQESNSCQSFARRLLREVFKEKALGVCASLTEMRNDHYRTRPDARPLLDPQGSSVLLNYIILYGSKRNWLFTVPDVLNALDHDIKELRSKYDVQLIF